MTDNIEEQKSESTNIESVPVEENNDAPKIKSKRKIIIICAATAVVFLVIGSIIGYRVYVNNRANERFSLYKSDIESGSFDDALQIYNDYADDKLFRDLSYTYLEDTTSALSVEETDKDYLAALLDSDIDFSSKQSLIESVKETVINIVNDGKEKQENLEELSTMLDEYLVFVTPDMSDEISDAKGFFNKIISSQGSFSDAKRLYDVGDYYDAIDKYSEVIKEDINYDSAQKIIKDSKEIVKKDALSIASEAREKEEYDAALSPLDQFLKYYDDAEVSSLKDEIAEEKRIKEETERLTSWVQGSWKSKQGGGTIVITEKSATIKGLNDVKDFVMNGGLTVDLDNTAVVFSGTGTIGSGSTYMTINAKLTMTYVSDNEAKGVYGGTFGMKSPIAILSFSSRPLRQLSFDAEKIE